MQQGGAPQPKRSGGGIMKIVGGIVVIVIIALVLYMFVLAPQKSKLEAVLPINKSLSISQFTSDISQVEGQVSQENVSYTGSLNVTITQGSSSFSLPLPFSFIYQRIGNDSRSYTSFTIPSLLSVGSSLAFNVTAINASGKTYVCAPFNEGSYNNTVTCLVQSDLTKYESASGQSSGVSSLFNTTSILDGINITITSETPTTKNGNSCLLLNGTVSGTPKMLSALTGGSTSVNVAPISGTFTTCVSDSYYVPLIVSGKGSVAISSGQTGEKASIGAELSANETSIGKPLTDQEVTSLPGKVINYTQLISNTGYGSGTTCIAAPGFLCQAPTLATNGNLSFSFGESTGSSMYNIGLGCVATSNNYGHPNPGNAVVLLNTYGEATSEVASSLNTTSFYMNSGSEDFISNLKCFGASGSPISSITQGSTFTGSLFLNYTTNSSAPSSTNPWLSVKVATLTLKAV